jgi:hypothetical protein
LKLDAVLPKSVSNLEPSQGNRQSLAAVLAVLEEYGDTL